MAKISKVRIHPGTKLRAQQTSWSDKFKITLPSKAVEVFYESAASDNDENDRIIIKVQSLPANSSVGNSIRVRTLAPFAKLRGTGYSIGRIKVSARGQSAFSKSIQSQGHVYISIKRENGYSPQDVLKSIQNQLSPRFQITKIHFVTASSDLPGGPTGPGPGPRPPKPPKPSKGR